MENVSGNDAMKGRRDRRAPHVALGPNTTVPPGEILRVTNTVSAANHQHWKRGMLDSDNKLGLPRCLYSVGRWQLVMSRCMDVPYPCECMHTPEPDAWIDETQHCVIWCLFSSWLWRIRYLTNTTNSNSSRPVKSRDWREQSTAGVG